MKCSKCNKALTEEEAIDGPGGRYCATCFCELARQPKRLTPEERQRLKRAVKDEMAGVLPREALREIIEDGYHALLIPKDDFDEVVNRTLNHVDQTAGLSMCEEVLGVIAALQATLREQETAIREKIKKLAMLTKES